MKANELMIGDWFVCSDPHPFKVVSIEFDDPYYRVWGNDGFPVDLGDLEPIPLTEEILKANGFMDVDGGLLRLDIPEGHICYANSVLLICVKKKMNLELWDVNYVHELQHALRLLGLNELADNFKIE